MRALQIAATGMSASILFSAVCISPMTAALSFLRSAAVTKLGLLRYFAISGPAASVPPFLAWVAAVTFLVSLSALLWQASLSKVSQGSEDMLRADLVA